MYLLNEYGIFKRRYGIYIIYRHAAYHSFEHILFHMLHVRIYLLYTYICTFFWNNIITCCIGTYVCHSTVSIYIYVYLYQYIYIHVLLYVYCIGLSVCLRWWTSSTRTIKAFFFHFSSISSGLENNPGESKTRLATWVGCIWPGVIEQQAKVSEKEQTRLSSLETVTWPNCVTWCPGSPWWSLVAFSS